MPLGWPAPCYLWRWNVEMKSLAFRSDGPELLWSAPCFPHLPFLFHERIDINIWGIFSPFFSLEHDNMTIHFRALILRVVTSVGAKCKVLLLGVGSPSSPAALELSKAHLHTPAHHYIDLISTLMKCQAPTHFYVLLSSSEGSFLWKGVRAHAGKFELAKLQSLPWAPWCPGNSELSAIFLVTICKSLFCDHTSQLVMVLELERESRLVALKSISCFLLHVPHCVSSFSVSGLGSFPKERNAQHRNCSLCRVREEKGTTHGTKTPGEKAAKQTPHQPGAMTAQFWEARM